MLATSTEIKNNFGKYLKHITNEKSEVIITKNNERVARLVPYVTDMEMYWSVKENALNYEYQRRTVSYEEFMDIYENSDSRMEYIDGEIYLMSSPNIKHQEILGNLYMPFKVFFKGKKCKTYMAPFDVHFRKKDLDTPDVMQPDLIVVCDLEGNVNHKNKYMGTPTLVLEILSPSTRSIDMVTKLNIYMKSGVLEYWIVDPETERITMYTFDRYQIKSMDLYRKGESLASLAFEGLEIKVDEVFEDLI